MIYLFPFFSVHICTKRQGRFRFVRRLFAHIFPQCSFAQNGAFNLIFARRRKVIPFKSRKNRRVPPFRAKVIDITRQAVWHRVTRTLYHTRRCPAERFTAPNILHPVRDKSIGTEREVCKPRSDFLRAPLSSCRLHKHDHHALSRRFLFCDFFTSRRSRSPRRTDRQNNRQCRRIRRHRRSK